MLCCAVRPRPGFICGIDHKKPTDEAENTEQQARKQRTAHFHLTCFSNLLPHLIDLYIIFGVGWFVPLQKLNPQKNAFFLGGLSMEKPRDPSWWVFYSPSPGRGLVSQAQGFPRWEISSITCPRWHAVSWWKAERLIEKNSRKISRKILMLP